MPMGRQLGCKRRTWMDLESEKGWTHILTKLDRNLKPLAGQAKCGPSWSTRTVTYCSSVQSLSQ